MDRFGFGCGARIFCCGIGHVLSPFQWDFTRLRELPSRPRRVIPTCAAGRMAASLLQDLAQHGHSAADFRQIHGAVAEHQPRLGLRPEVVAAQGVNLDLLL